MSVPAHPPLRAAFPSPFPPAVTEMLRFFSKDTFKYINSVSFPLFIQVFTPLLLHVGKSRTQKLKKTIKNIQSVFDWLQQQHCLENIFKKGNIFDKSLTSVLRAKNGAHLFIDIHTKPQGKTFFIPLSDNADISRNLPRNQLGVKLTKDCRGLKLPLFSEPKLQIWFSICKIILQTKTPLGS